MEAKIFQSSLIEYLPFPFKLKFLYTYDVSFSDCFSLHFFESRFNN